MSGTLLAGPTADECDQKLEQEILRIIREDQHQIISKYFHLTVLRTSRRIMKDAGPLKQGFDDYVYQQTAKLRELHEKSPQTMTSIQDLYRQEGSEKILALSQKLPQFKDRSRPDGKAINRFGNEEVAAWMLQDRLVNGTRSSFTAQDVAITWFVSELKKRLPTNSPSATRNLMETGVHVNRYIGFVADTPASSVAELDRDIEKNQTDLGLTLKKLEGELKTRMAECFSGQGIFTGSCELDLTNNIVSLMGSSQLVIDQLRSQTVESIKASAKDSAPVTPQLVVKDSPAPAVSQGRPSRAPPARLTGRAATRVKTPPKKKNSGNGGWWGSKFSKASDNSCPGFSSKVRNQRFLGMAPGVKANWNTAMQSLKAALNRTGVCKVNRPYFEFGGSTEERSFCCQKQVRWGRDWHFSAGFASNIRCDIHLVGLGPIASAGAFFGFELNAYGNGHVIQDCSNKAKCLSVSAGMRPNGGVFAQALANTARLEGGIRASPSFLGSQCFSPQGPGPFQLRGRWGHIAMYWQLEYFGFATRGSQPIINSPEWKTYFERQVLR